MPVFAELDEGVKPGPTGAAIRSEGKEGPFAHLEVETEQPPLRNWWRESGMLRGGST